DADPSNSSWQRDLSVSHERIGDVLTAQGSLAGALDAYHQALAIRKRLADADPSNSEWQRDLSVSYWKLAEVHEGLGDSGEARHFRRRARDVLRGMRARNMYLDPPLARALEYLEGLDL
ncbi:MAG: tetratricopeptide repeat protein, partial [Planctomycetes bacterium]|nr:tetratricopeptide repeat protein [Planctomycetota bacterium]